jgi:hypothetical protein
MEIAMTRRSHIVWILLGLLAPIAMLWGCNDATPARQSTPDETIATARAMLLAGEGERLHELVYANSDDMRMFLNRTGRMLGNLETLSTSIQTRWPEEVAKLKARAEEAAKKGQPTSLMGQVAGQTMRQNRRQRGGPPRGEQRQGFDDGITRLFADPYAMLRESEGKLQAVYMTDDQMALTWEGKPVLAPLGMTMRKGEDNKWYFELPLNIPGVSGFMPKTKEQWELFGGVVTVLDKVVVDLNKEIETGQLQTMEAVSRRAGEMTFIPAAMVLYAYTKLRDEQKQQVKPGT